MARLRKRLVRVDSTEVQGPGSYVVYEAITVGMMRTINMDADGSRNELLARTIAEWNWTDDEGNPLPLPKQAPDALDNLLVEEFNWLASHAPWSVSGEERKN